MSYYIGFTHNDGSRDIVRMSDAQVVAAVMGQPDSIVRDALAAHILRFYGLASASGIRSIDMVREVPDVRRKRPQDATTPPGRPRVPINPLKPHHPLSIHYLMDDYPYKGVITWQMNLTIILVPRPRQRGR